MDWLDFDTESAVDLADVLVPLPCGAVVPVASVAQDFSSDEIGG